MSEPGTVSPSEIGEYPASWRVQRFDCLFEVQQGKQVSKSNRVGNNQRPFLRTRNVLWGKLDLAELDEMHFSDADVQRLSLESGDLLICEGGDIGRTAIWGGAVRDCYYQNHLHRARLKNQLDGSPEFALYWLWYAFNVGSVYFGRGNTTTIPNLSQSKLRALPMPVPPLDEQRSIAAVLSLVQRAIEQQERLIELTTELKKALMHKLFTEGLRGEPQKETEIGPVPESWDVAPLGGFLTRAQYGVSAKGTADGRYPLLRMTNQNDGRITAESLQHIDLDEGDVAKYLLAPGDVLFNRTNSAELVGRTSLFDLEGDFVFASHLIRLRTNEERYPAALLNHYFNWPETQDRLKGIATRGVSQSNISANRLKGFLVPVPPAEDHTPIIELLDGFDRLISIQRSKGHALGDLFRTLLHHLMTAQVRVNELDLTKLES